MKVAHIVPITPHKCGMYETARELVVAETKLGIDSRLFDPRPSMEDLFTQIKNATNAGKTVTVKPESFREPEDFEDRGATNSSKEFLKGADIIVSHSGIQPQALPGEQPIIHVMHGRPYSSFMLEERKKADIYSTYHKWGTIPRFKAFVTLWPEYVSFLCMIIPEEKIHSFDAFVDTDLWKPGRDETFDFHSSGGEINIVSTDMWRLDKDPYYVVNAYALFHKKYPKAKIHIFSCQPTKMDLEKQQIQIEGAWGSMFACMKEKNMIGETMLHIKNIEVVYQNADVLITPHVIATRTVREALSCGCQVVAGLENRFTPYTAYVENQQAFANEIERAYLDRMKDPEGVEKRNRQIAIDNFSTEKTAKQFLNLYEEVLISDTSRGKRTEDRSPITGLCTADC